MAKPFPKLVEERLGGHDELLNSQGTQIFDNLKRYTDFVIDVAYCNGNTDVDKLKNAFALAIGLKTTNTCYIKSSKILTINSSVLLDFNDATGIMIDISFTPTTGIGDAITLYGGKNIIATFNIINGGLATDYGVVIKRMVESKVIINGRNCLSTLFKSNGTGTEISYGMQVGLRNYQCGQTMEVGVNGTYASGFGEFEYVWEEKPLRGSIVQNMYDITFKHYENHIVDTTHTVTSLLLKNVYGSNFGVLSLGGKAKNLVTFQDSTISIGRLHLGSEDVYDDGGNYNASLTKITDGVYVTGVSSLFAEHMYTTHLNNILTQTGKQNIEVKRLQTNGDENAFIVKDGVNLNYPINVITSYKSYIDNKFSDTKVQTVFRDKCTALNKQTGGTVVPNVYRETDSNTFVLDSTIFNNNDQSIKMVQPSASRAQVILDVNFTAGQTYMLETNFKAQGFASDTEFEIYMEYRTSGGTVLTVGWYTPFKVHTNDGFYLDNIRLIGKVAPASTAIARLVFYLTKNSATSPQVNIDGLTIKTVS